MMLMFKRISGTFRDFEDMSKENIIEDTDVLTSDYGIEALPCSSFSGDNLDNDINTFVCVFEGDYLPMCTKIFISVRKGM